jgi:hypothetical protein
VLQVPFAPLAFAGGSAEALLLFVFIMMSSCSMDYPRLILGVCTGWIAIIVDVYGVLADSNVKGSLPVNAIWIRDLSVSLS